MDTRVASGYSDALYEIASENKAWDIYKKNLNLIVDTLKDNSDLMVILDHPKVTKEDKKEMLVSVFETIVEHNMLSFLKLLVDKNRMRGIFEIARAYTHQYNEAHGIEVAHVCTAHALDESEVKSLQAMLEKKTGKKIELVISIDESLLAGLRIKIKDEVLDNTAKTRLAGMRSDVTSASL